jgi:hypothetical protein
MHVATIRLEPEIWAVVEQRARQERRPIGTMLRIIVSDAVRPAAEHGPDGSGVAA